jgi:hypothetical protein
MFMCPVSEPLDDLERGQQLRVHNIFLLIMKLHEMASWGHFQLFCLLLIRERARVVDLADNGFRRGDGFNDDLLRGPLGLC